MCESYKCSVTIAPDPVKNTLTGQLGIVIEHVCPFTWPKVAEMIDVEENNGKTFVIGHVFRDVRIPWPKIQFERDFTFGFTETNIFSCVDFVKQTKVKNVGSWFFKWRDDGSIIIDREYNFYHLIEIFSRVSKLCRKRRYLRFEKIPYSADTPKNLLASIRKRDPSFYLFQLKHIRIDEPIDDPYDVEMLVFILSLCCDKLQTLEVDFTEQYFQMFRSQISTLRFPVLRNFQDLSYNRFTDDTDEISFVRTNFPVLETYNGGCLLPRSLFQSSVEDQVPFDIASFTALNTLRSRDAYRVYFYLKHSMAPPLAAMIAQHFFTKRLEAFDYTKSEEYTLLLKCGNPDVILLPRDNTKLNSLVDIFTESASTHHYLKSNLEESRKDQEAGIKRRRVDKNLEDEIFEFETRLETSKLVLDHLVQTMKKEVE